jgi:hypothetical protein
MGIVTLKALYAPKEGNSDAQYEDAFAVSSVDSPVFTVALADGASSAGFARDWAERLTKTFVAANGFPDTDDEAAAIIAHLGREWRETAAEKAVSWHAQEKLENGSAATLLVVTFDTVARTWKARAMGDICIFLIRKEKLRYAFPLTRAAQFNDRPTLLSTEIGSRVLMPVAIRYEEKYEPGDRFLLMTDAFSQWFLKEFESRRRPWNDFPTTQLALASWLKPRRDKGLMKNDDVTLLDLIL